MKSQFQLRELLKLCTELILIFYTKSRFKLLKDVTLYLEYYPIQPRNKLHRRQKRDRVSTNMLVSYARCNCKLYKRTLTYGMFLV
jgi:hypothetical protein